MLLLIAGLVVMLVAFAFFSAILRVGQLHKSDTRVLHVLGIIFILAFISFSGGLLLLLI